MQFNRYDVGLILGEAFKCLIGTYTPQTSLKRGIRWINRALLLTLSLMALAMLSAGILNRLILKDLYSDGDYQALTWMDIYNSRYGELIKRVKPETLFLLAIYVQCVKFFFTLLIITSCIYLLKFRTAYSLYSRRNVFRLDVGIRESIPKLALHLALNPLLFDTCETIQGWNLFENPCPIKWEEIINNLFSKKPFPKERRDVPLVQTKDLAFMYHGDFSWDGWFHNILKKISPSIYKRHLISSNTLTKSQEFERSDPRILKGVTLSINGGKFTTILGCNGSSKSVLLKTIIHLLEKYEGTISWIGRDLKKISPKSFYKNVAYVDQNNIIHNDISVYDYVACGLFPSLKFFKFRDSKNDNEILKNLEKMEILHHKDKSVRQLSGGEKQRAVLARVLTQKTDVIILDEPTTYLDINAQYKILNLLKKLQLEENKTIITVLHDIDQAKQFSDEVILMDEGQVYAYGKVNDIISKRNIEDIFEVPWN